MSYSNTNYHLRNHFFLCCRFFEQRATTSSYNKHTRMSKCVRGCDYFISNL